MHNSKLIKLAATLSVPELRQFEELARSSFFNKQAVLADFAALIRREAPEFNAEVFARKALFQKLFPGEIFHQQKLYDHGSYLLKLLERFLAVKDFLEDENAETILGLKQLRLREQNTLFHKRLREASKKLAQSSTKDENWFHQSFDLASESEAFFSQVTKESERVADDNLQAKADSLEAFFLAARLKQACEMINRQNVIGAKYNLESLQGVLALYNSDPSRFSAIPALRIYFIILKTLTEAGNEKWYHELLNELEHEAHLFKKTEAKSMYQYAQNYCIKKVNSGESEYLIQVFELYKRQLATELLLEKGRLSQWDYKNIVSVGLRINETEWTGEFIRNYLKNLDPLVQENAFAYNQAQLEYSKGDYGEVLRLLQKVEFTDIFYQLGTRSTLLRTFFEMNEFESLRSHLSAFSIFLNRSQKISPYQVKIHKNLIFFTRKLLRPKESQLTIDALRFEQERKKIEAELTKGPATANLNWLKEKIKE